jgi:hypothetical protein
MNIYRILNGMIWFWLWLSAAIDFVPDPPDRFRGLFQLSNSFDEAYKVGLPGEIVGRALVFLLPWFLVDRFLRKRGRPKAKE